VKQHEVLRFKVLMAMKVILLLYCDAMFTRR